MDDQREYITIPEIAKRVGKSETTVRRWLEKVKKANPTAILKEEHGNYFTYKVEKAEVDTHFKIKQETDDSTKTNDGVSSNMNIPKGYILVHEETLKQTQNQIEESKKNAERMAKEMEEKNLQISELLRTNTNISGFIADLGKQKLLDDTPEVANDPVKADLSDVLEESSTTRPNEKNEPKKESKKPLRNRKGKVVNNNEITIKESETKFHKTNTNKPSQARTNKKTKTSKKQVAPKKKQEKNRKETAKKPQRKSFLEKLLGY